MNGLIVHLCYFAPETTGSTFLDALSHVARTAKHRVDAETLLVFPEKALERPWLDNLDVWYVCADPASVHWRDWPKNTILHSHFCGYDTLASALRILNPSFRTVIHLHSGAPRTTAQALRDLIKIRGLGRWAHDRYIAVADNTYANARARGIPPNKLRLVRNAIDVKKYKPDGEIRRRTRAEMGFQDGDTVVLLLGWDPHRKGVDIFLDAVARVKGQVVPCIIGQKATEEYIAQIALNGHPVHKKLRLLEPTDDFPAMLNAVDVFVSASRSDAAMSYAVMEAMAAEKLVLVSNLPGTESLGTMVQRFSMGDSIALARLIDGAVDLDAETRMQIGFLNRDRITRIAAMEEWANQVCDVYEEVMAPQLKLVDAA